MYNAFNPAIPVTTICELLLRSKVRKSLHCANFPPFCTALERSNWRLRQEDSSRILLTSEHRAAADAPIVDTLLGWDLKLHLQQIPLRSLCKHKTNSVVSGVRVSHHVIAIYDTNLSIGTNNGVWVREHFHKLYWKKNAIMRSGTFYSDMRFSLVIVQEFIWVRVITESIRFLSSGIQFDHIYCFSKRKMMMADAWDYAAKKDYIEHLGLGKKNM